MNALSPSGLREHEASDASWWENENYNIGLLNTTLLHPILSGLDEIVLSSLLPDEVLKYSETTGKWHNTNPEL